MIIFFGLAGSGKSVQSELLSKAIGWRHVSAGALLRQQTDPQLQADLAAGKLADYRVTNRLMRQILDETKDRLIMDGYPRQMPQAQWLIDEHRRIDLCIVLDTTVDVIKQRLALRGRSDDQASAIEQRIKIFESETVEVLDFFSKNNVKIVHIDGDQTIEAVHSVILAEVNNVFTTN